LRLSSTHPKTRPAHECQLRAVKKGRHRLRAADGSSGPFGGREEVATSAATTKTAKGFAMIIALRCVQLLNAIGSSEHVRPSRREADMEHNWCGFYDLVMSAGSATAFAISLLHEWAKDLHRHSNLRRLFEHIEIVPHVRYSRFRSNRFGASHTCCTMRAARCVLAAMVSTGLGSCSMRYSAASGDDTRVSVDLDALAPTRLECAPTKREMSCHEA
jgi:hypothetical protein